MQQSDLSGFRKTGFCSQIPQGRTITRFQVLGERASGTNYVKRLLGRNTNLTPTEALGWKHGAPHALGIPPDLLVIAVVRNAVDWSLSVHARPWHTSSEMQKLPFSDFLRAPWDTRIDRARYFPGSRAAGILGQPLQMDRCPDTGGLFANIFALRQAKLRALLSLQGRDCACVLLRLEDVVKDPVTCLTRVQHCLGRPGLTAEFRPVYKRLGSKFKPAVNPRPSPPEAMSEEDFAFMRESLDTEQEARLGYRYSFPSIQTPSGQKA